MYTGPWLDRYVPVSIDVLTHDTSVCTGVLKMKKEKKSKTKEEGRGKKNRRWWRKRRKHKEEEEKGRRGSNEGRGGRRQ